jgi:pimeloyl-ACP methyl ester carboxylesterase/DNA-binding CsgD family transcriptional regulator
MDPIIKYARTSDGVNIAYFSVGTGGPLVYVPPGGSAGQAWQQPELRSWLERLAARRRLIRLDYRGIGLSDHGWKFSPELTANDVKAVVEKECLQRFALLGGLHTAATAVVFASRFPEAVSHVILWCPYASARDYVDSSPALQAAIAAGERDWQTLTELIGLQASGWRDADQARRFAAYLRAGVDPGHYIDMGDFDVLPQLSELTMPVLVLHRREVQFPTVEVARQVASNAPSARFVLLEGSALMPFFGDTEPVLSTIEDFLAESVQPERPAGLTQRELEILGLLAGGASNEHIARTLTISCRTVERHIGNIYVKIRAHNRAEATAYAFRQAIVSAAQPLHHVERGMAHESSRL